MRRSVMFLFLVVSFLAPVALPAQSSDEDGEEAVSELEEWRATLMFGINSELQDLIPSLTEQGIDQLSEEVIAVFERSVDTDVRIAALDYLEEFEDGGGHVHALQLLEDYDLIESRLARRLLGYLQETGHEPDADGRDLVRTIAGEDELPLVATAAIRYLAAGGEEPSFFTDLYDDLDANEDIRAEILLALGDLGDRDSFDFVVSLLDPEEEASSMIERYAIDTLGRLGDERAVPIIMRQMDASDATTRAYAVSALTKFEGDEIDGALLAALRDDFWRVRTAALEAIGERKSVDAVPIVTYKLRRDPEEPVRLAAMKTLVAIDAADGWEAIVERAEQSRTPETERLALLDELVQYDPRRALPILEEILVAEWDKDRSTLLDGVGKIISIHPAGAFQPLYERLLGHRNFILQIYAIRGAGGAGIASLKGEIEARAEEGNHRAVRNAALRVLEKM